MKEVVHIEFPDYDDDTGRIVPGRFTKKVTVVVKPGETIEDVLAKVKRKRA